MTPPLPDLEEQVMDYLRRNSPANDYIPIGDVADMMKDFAARVAARAKQEERERKDGAGLIARERRRQVEGEGWTREHDSQHESVQLARAAACYALPWSPTVLGVVPKDWPWDASWWKPKDRLSNLIRAGALIAAEIDRLLDGGKEG